MTNNNLIAVTNVEDTFRNGVGFANISMRDENRGGSSIKMMSVNIGNMGTKDKNRILSSVSNNISVRLKESKGMYTSTTALVGDIVDYMLRHGRIDSDIISKLLIDHNKTNKIFQGEHAYRQFDEGVYKQDTRERLLYNTDLQNTIEDAIDEIMNKR
jgi:hypothetical protein